MVEDRFGFVRVRGELSGVKRAASGHLYLSLKDEGARLDGVMWKGSVQRLSFVPEDGVEVVASGKLTTYPGRSNYQLVIERMEVAGEGALLALLAKTKARLEAEGLFDPSRKRPIPYLPRVIGVVTSPTGAVIRDILHRLAPVFPPVCGNQNKAAIAFDNRAQCGIFKGVIQRGNGAQRIDAGVASYVDGGRIQPLF